jgi:hypothetical protein
VAFLLATVALSECPPTPVVARPLMAASAFGKPSTFAECPLFRTISVITEVANKPSIIRKMRGS